MSPATLHTIPPQQRVRPLHRLSSPPSPVRFGHSRTSPSSWGQKAHTASHILMALFGAFLLFAHPDHDTNHNADHDADHELVHSPDERPSSPLQQREPSEQKGGLTLSDWFSQVAGLDSLFHIVIVVANLHALYQEGRRHKNKDGSQEAFFQAQHLFKLLGIKLIAGPAGQWTLQPEREPTLPELKQAATLATALLNGNPSSLKKA